MKKLLELRQEKSALKSAMRSLLEKADAEKRSLTAEEGKQFDEHCARAESLDKDISRLEAVAEEERRQPGQPAEGKTLTSDELRTWIMTGETRALSTAEGADGGYTVIPELDKEIMRRVTDDSVMRAISTVKTTKSNAYKKLISTAGAAVKRGGENEARTETATPKLEEVVISLNPVYAYPKTTQEILDFSEVDILAWLASEIADTFTETEDEDFVNGDGTKKAKGFLSYPRTAVADKTRPFGTLEKFIANGAGGGASADDLIDLLFKLKAKYRKNAVWVMNSGTAAAFQKLKNGNGDYIWRDRLTETSPDMLLGRPVHYLETMPDLDTVLNEGGPVAAVGDFTRGYYIVDHTTGVRTRPDNITEPGFYKVHTDKYLGGGVVDFNAIKVLEIAKPS